MKIVSYVLMDFKILFRKIVQWNQIIPDDEKCVLETSEYPGVHSLPTGVHGFTMFGYTDLSIASRTKESGSGA